MADLLKGLFGAAKSSVTSIASADADFADFATAPAPVAPSHAATTVSSVLAAAPTSFLPSTPFANRPYTKWYNIHERVTLADFTLELWIVPLVLAIVLVHLWGTRANRRKAHAWMGAHSTALMNEFAVVGFAKKTAAAGAPELLREKSKDVFLAYATGRQNVAFVDLKLSLYKRYNPFALLSDAVMSFFFESMPMVGEKVEATAYAFDGKEAALVPRLPGADEPSTKGRDSAYDGFVWAIVHKDAMNRLRTDRYDLSLTSTKDHARLPAWATVMSESPEITETLLTKELIAAVEQCGENLESFVITDMPEDAPKTLDDLVPKKRLSLSMRLRTTSATTPPPTLPLFACFLRTPDVLVSSAHFRPEVLRRVRATREDEGRKIRKVDEAERAESRKTASDKAKRDERERKLKGMNADEQRKFLDRERDRDAKRSQKGKTVKA